MKAASERTALRILCISPVFVPVADSEAFCGAKMVQALLDSGSSVTVLASDDIRRGGLHDDSGLWHSMRDITVNIPQLPRPDLLRSLMTASQFQTPFFARWIGRVVTTATQLHRASKFDLVYSRSLPMIAHVAGFWCAKKFKLPWVANINDPWEIGLFPGSQTELPAFVLRAYMFWLKRTLLNADLITYPCNGLHDFHANLAKLNHSAEIISHIGYRRKSSTHHQNGQFRLVHAGKLGANELTGRSSKALLAGLKAFLSSSPDAAAETKLVFVGPEDKEAQSWISQFGLAGNVENVGRVNYENSLDYMASASVCILIESGTNESIFFPSKLADYLVSGKPVLALSPPTGIAADFASCGELIRVDHDPDAVCHTLTRLYSEFKRGTLGWRKASDRLIKQLQGQSVAEKFLSACRKLLSQAQATYWVAQSKVDASAGRVHTS